MPLRRIYGIICKLELERVVIYSDSEVVSHALNRYYEMNGLPADGGVGDKWARYKFGSFKAIAFPNFQQRVRAIERHDLHHIVNDLDTSNLGEGLIAAWELGSGCGKFWISWFMESQALWWGILLAPQRMLTLFLIGRSSKNYFHEDFNQELFKKTVGEIRTQLLPSASVKRCSFFDIVRLVSVATLGLISMILFFPIVLFFSLLTLFL
jgi:hypothetical protein